MKLSITRDSLHAGLGAVAATIPAKTTLPVLSNILLEAKEGSLSLSGTDLDISVSVKIDAEVEREGSVTVPARKFAEIARELPAAPVHIEVDGVEIRIEGGKSRFKLFGLAPEEFPSFPEVEFDDSWRMKATDLHELISRVSFAVSTDESRPILNGVLWQLRPDSATMVATSAWRACTTHERGKIRLRSRSPMKKTNGRGASATAVSPTSITTMTITAAINNTSCMAMSGPNANSNWIDRMSLLALEITCPDWVRS